MKKNSFLITGGSGLLGSVIYKKLKSLNYTVTKQSRKKKKFFIKINLFDKIKTNRALRKLKPNIIIHTAGLTGVDKCQKDYNKAYNSNVRILENICDYINLNHNCHLINISTDHLYSDLGPHNENNIKIINNYALTKYLGELVAKKVDATNLRVNFVGKSISTKKSLTDWFIESCNLKKKIKLYKNIFFSPLEINQLAEIIIKISQKKISGVYNLGSRNGMSKSKFLISVGKLMNLSLKNIKEVNFINNKKNTLRPNDMRLDISLFEKNFKIKLPNLNDVIKKVAKSYLNEL